MLTGKRGSIPKDTVGSYPVLLVRKLVRALTNRLYWDLETVERILRLRPNEASGVIKALEAAGLAKANRGKVARSGPPRSWRNPSLPLLLRSGLLARRQRKRWLSSWDHHDRFLARLAILLQFSGAIMKRNIVAGLGTP